MYPMYCNKTRYIFVFTTPLTSNHPASVWLSKHGDGVRDIALLCGHDQVAHDSCISRDFLKAY